MKKRPFKHLAHTGAFEAAPIVFFTVVAFDRRPILASSPIHDAIRGIWIRSAEHNGWFVGRYVIMPDHVHFFARPRREADSIQQ